LLFLLSHIATKYTNHKADIAVAYPYTFQVDTNQKIENAVCVFLGETAKKGQKPFRTLHNPTSSDHNNVRLK
jgi:hypothetical protein